MRDLFTTPKKGRVDDDVNGRSALKKCDEQKEMKKKKKKKQKFRHKKPVKIWTRVWKSAEKSNFRQTININNS